MANKNAVGNALTGVTGTGTFVGNTSPTLVTPDLGTPSNGVLSNCTGYPDAAKMFVASRTTAQTITTSTNTKIQISTATLNTVGSDLDTTTNYRHTPTTAGYWLYIAQASIQAATDGSNIRGSLYKNGSEYAANIKYLGSAGGATSSIVALVQMNGSTDYVELYIYQNSGSDKSTHVGAYSSFLAGTYIGS